MIFESISLTHLFSYQHADIDLSGNTPEKNIVLISGRNGFGKTSFINAIKLLFTGVSDELRSSVQAGRKLSVKAYVLGQGEDWLGILNRHARQQGQNHCAVEIHWREQGLGRVRAQRRWFNITADHYETQLEIELLDEKKWLKEDETQNFLDQRLPEDYLGFFSTTEKRFKNWLKPPARSKSNKPNAYSTSARSTL